MTILRIGSLLTPHEFLGMLLIPPVALKLAATLSWDVIAEKTEEAYRRCLAPTTSG